MPARAQECSQGFGHFRVIEVWSRIVKNARCEPRRNLYDDVDEYWVTTRETGSRKETLAVEERQTDIGKASMPETP